MSMESYIVRVYRREAEDAKNLIGLVEIVETQEKKAFNNFDELRHILSSHDPNSNHRQLGTTAKIQRRKLK